MGSGEGINSMGQANCMGKPVGELFWDKRRRYTHRLRSLNERKSGKDERTDGHGWFTVVLYFESVDIKARMMM